MKLYDVIRKEESNNPKWKKKPPSAPSHVHHESRQPISIKKKMVIFGGSIVFLAALYTLGNHFVYAKIVVTERRIPITLTNVDLELMHETEATNGRLSFQTMVVTTTITREVYGSGISASNTKATGSVVFFNEYSKSKQTIKKGSTLTASNGKRYTTLETVSVSGYTMNGKTKVPGTSLPTKIQAVQTGSEYNTTGTTFTIFGWGKSLYGRSAGAVSGGDAGVAHVLTETEKKDALLTLQAQLIERLKRESRAQIPDTLTTFPDLQVPIIDQNSLVLQGSGVRFPAKLSGSMVSYLIPRDLLEQTIALKGIRDTTYSAVSVPDVSGLEFELMSPAPTDPAVVPESITIRVNGSATIIAKAPIEKLRESLIGAKRKTFDTILSKLPEIETATLHLYPFWSPRFPNVEKKIDIRTK